MENSVEFSEESPPPQEFSSSPSSLFLVVGLGNSGSSFIGTRHNIGRDSIFRFVSDLRESFIPYEKTQGCRQTRPLPMGPGRSVIFASPESFMNLSGPAVLKLLKQHKIPLTNLIVLHDELDIKFGEIRIRSRGSAGGQNGMKSLLGTLGGYYRTGPAEDLPFIRIRIGIGRPEKISSSSSFLDAVKSSFEVSHYVLQKFSPEESRYLDEFVERIGCSVSSVVTEGILAAATKFNGPAKNTASAQKRKNIEIPKKPDSQRQKKTKRPDEEKAVEEGKSDKPAS